MVQQTINVGSAANDGTGDTVRAAFTKTNANATELYNKAAAALAGLPTISGAVLTFTKGDGTTGTITLPGGGGGVSIGTTSGTARDAALAIAAEAAAQSTATAALPKAGGTMTGALTLAGAPSAALGAATKGYVDTAVAGVTGGLPAPSGSNTINALTAGLLFDLVDTANGNAAKYISVANFLTSIGELPNANTALTAANVASIARQILLYDPAGDVSNPITLANLVTYLQTQITGGGGSGGLTPLVTFTGAAGAPTGTQALTTTGSGYLRDGKGNLILPANNGSLPAAFLTGLGAIADGVTVPIVLGGNTPGFDMNIFCNGDGTGSNTYVWALSASTNGLQVGKIVGGTYTNISGDASFDSIPATWSVAEVACSGAVKRLYLDGKRVGQVSDSSFVTGGTLGIQASANVQVLVNRIGVPR